MGYNTKYILEVRHTEAPKILPSPVLEDVLSQLRTEFSEANYALTEIGDCSELAKWYEHEEDLRKFSKRFPLYLFVLSGQGEISADVWKKYFVNGKVQITKSKFQIEPFDKQKLR